MSAPTTTPCPSCGAQAMGRFCASCGSPVSGASCNSCAAPLSPGAKFCHLCGTPAGATARKPSAAAPSTGIGGALPWAVAAIALVALIALVAGQRFRGPAGGAPAAAATATSPQGTARAPDIANLSPRERADRLYNRIMMLSEQGKPDSVLFFAPMALMSYEMLPDVDLDARYDWGRVAEVVARSDPSATAPDTALVGVARAQADTILAARPTHLLGLILAGNVARLRNDDASARGYDARFLQAMDEELRRGAPEYELHRADIDLARDRARAAR